jgi:hypothetical protein
VDEEAEGNAVSGSTSRTLSLNGHEEVSSFDHDYPRPNLRRRAWLPLDGTWSFSTCTERNPGRVPWEHSIRVPYPPESVLSGLSISSRLAVVWYRRMFEVPEQWRGQRLLLHFGAVDHSAEVWINGSRAGNHEGGHTPFTIDITELLTDGSQELVVRAQDALEGFDQLRGKQDWKVEPHSIWYPRTTGIWQSVWLEPLPESHIVGVRFTPYVVSFSVAVEVELSVADDALELEIELSHEGRLLARDRITAVATKVGRTVHLPDPGIDDARADLLWSPERPNLLDVALSLRDGETVLDRVETYVGLRSVEARDGRFYLNGTPYYQRLVLDQGYWNESHLTPPSGEALRTDVELAKAMGFNGVRKHQKLEDPRYLYWADRLGLLVWSELPSAYSFGPTSTGRLVSTWLEAIARDYNHPCIVAWVPFNESWGVPDLPASACQRDLVSGMYRLTKSLDPTRVVIDNDGWEHGQSDLFTVHDYSDDPEAVTRRYGSREQWQRSAGTFRPGGRSLQLEDGEVPGALLISEFGGIRYGAGGGGWGYSEADSEEALLDRISRLVRALRSSPVVSGFCYTQLADTFQEQNGLLYADRRPKLPLEVLADVFGRGGGS